MQLPMQKLKDAVAASRYPLLFASVSGAHLYGFPSPDSDFDLRGAHVLPARDILALTHKHDTLELMRNEPGFELDLVTHDLGMYFDLLLKKSGNMLEQLYSPLVVHSTPEHEELKAIAVGCITSSLSYHYLGFAQTQWRLFAKEPSPRVKPLLYTYRVLLTGIHVMETGKVEPNLVELNKTYRLAYIDDLIALKLAGPEKGVLKQSDLAFHEAQKDRLEALLRERALSTHLPEAPTCAKELSELLVRVRLKTLG
jgi:uncharacterized protein